MEQRTLGPAESVLIAGDIFHAPAERAEPTCVVSTDGVLGSVTEAGTGYTWTTIRPAPAAG
ncbi:hypothetical protein [Streptacidiphilus jiangxiensis]|uniref:Uncharacterized protein n=1 Tax=Streptacidiphilus jiangxiensis TaxID=235985 RepID=A0A1H7WDG6_STRJI|nr:hypothetical protein [Streptacidiphilus jiangxiensis]SEM19048.1 hypothetical protein SAMN05414137_12062 [Streptacidiphilus jiangxiensis]